MDAGPFPLGFGPVFDLGYLALYELPAKAFVGQRAADHRDKSYHAGIMTTPSGSASGWGKRALEGRAARARLDLNDQPFYPVPQQPEPTAH
jgi:hypothetical protein